MRSLDEEELLLWAAYSEWKQENRDESAGRKGPQEMFEYMRRHEKGEE